MQMLDTTYYMRAFRKHVCGACRMCGSDFPAFCMTIYGGNSERFLNIIKHIRVSSILKEDFSWNFFTFEGFCGLFCNSRSRCPSKTASCNELDHVYACYEASIYEVFSGIETRSIGKSFRLSAKNPLRMLEKKKRRKINSLIKAARKGMKSDLQYPYGLGTVRNNVVVTRKRKPVVTSFFYNDDEEWKGTIDSYLKHETNNRQSTTNA